MQIVRYFDLSSRAGTPAVAATPAVMALAKQIAVYVFIAIGVLLSAALAQAQAGEAVALPSLDWTAIIIAGAIAFIVFPGAWAAIGGRADSPILVTLALAFQQGAFWSLGYEAVANSIQAQNGENPTTAILQIFLG